MGETPPNDPGVSLEELWLSDVRIRELALTDIINYSTTHTTLRRSAPRGAARRACSSCPLSAA